MSEPVRKTQARIAERERRRKQHEQRQRLYKIVPLVIVGVLVVLGVGYSVYTQVAKPPRPANAGVIGPRLQVDRDEMDLGNRPLNVAVRAAFNVKNTGDDTLNLLVPQSVTALEGCWPGNVVVGQTTLQPGESTTVYTDIVMHPGMEGKHLFAIPIKTNDPTQQTKDLKIASNWGNFWLSVGTIWIVTTSSSWLKSLRPNWIWAR